jgi:hypothetical protein
MGSFTDIKSFALEQVNIEVPRWAIIGSVILLSWWVQTPQVVFQIVSGSCIKDT